MKDITVVLIAQLPSIICASGSVLLAAQGSSAWGWFLFAAFLMICSRIKTS